MKKIREFFKRLKSRFQSWRNESQSMPAHWMRDRQYNSWLRRRDRGEL